MKDKMAVLFLLLTVFTCTKLPPNRGKSNEIVVVASKPDIPLINSLQTYNYVPQKEAIFHFLPITDTVIGNFQRYHTLFLYGSLKDEFIYTLLSPEARQATSRDTFTLFRLNDLWVRGQLVIVLAVAQPENIASGINKYHGLINQILADNYYERIKENFYYEGIDREIKRRMKIYGITLDLDKGWFIDSTYKDENFISVHSHFPDRSIFFYKEPRRYQLTDSFAIDKRNELTRKFYHGDYMLGELSTVDKIEFRDLKGIRIRGVWQNDSLVAGGPFISYWFVKRDTLFVIDGMLFNPGERKSDYLTRLEVIMNSFEIMNP